MVAPARKKSESSCLACVGDAFWTFPFLSTMWCVGLILTLIYMRGYADDLWAIADPMGWDTKVEEKWFALGFWVLVGVNAGALLLSLFTSGKLLEGMVAWSCCAGRAGCFCNGLLLLLVGLVYLGTLLSVPILLALEVAAAVLVMLVLQTSVACGYLGPTDLQSLVAMVSRELTARCPFPVPRFSLAADQVGPVCKSLEQTSRSAMIVVGLGFVAVLLQVLFSTSVFSRLWATRMEQQQLYLYRKVTGRGSHGGSSSSGMSKNDHEYRASITPDDEETGSVWEESKFGPLEEEANGTVVSLPGQRKGTFFASPYAQNH